MASFNLDDQRGGVGLSSPPPVSEEAEDEDMEDVMEAHFEANDSIDYLDPDPDPSDFPLTRTVTFTDEVPLKQERKAVDPRTPHYIEDLFGDAAQTEDLNAMASPYTPRIRSPRSADEDVRPSLVSPPLLPRERVRQEIFTAKTYDIVPTIAAPQGTSVNALCMTKDLRWVLTGGEDGWIRKYNWIDTANGKLPLTVAQRHPFVDSVTKAGVLLSYFENEEPTNTSKNALKNGDNLSPVYSLAVQADGLWLASGLESGSINLYSLRIKEGTRITSIKGHTSAISCLSLASDEQSLLSGSWDKNILDWDLNTGKAKRSFPGSLGQISSITPQPETSVPFPDESLSAVQLPSPTFDTNTDLKPQPTALVNGVKTEDTKMEEAQPEADLGSPAGSMRSLFGDDQDTYDEDGAMNNDDLFGDDEDEENDFTRAIAAESGEAQLPIQSIESGPPPDPVAKPENPEGSPPPPPPPSQPDEPTIPATEPQPEPTQREASIPDSQREPSIPLFAPGPAPAPDTAPSPPHPPRSPLQNGIITTPSPPPPPPRTSVNPPLSPHVFLSSAIDGTLRLWDRRQPAPVTTIAPRPGQTPPWCMSACWSPSGTSFYAGRRNGTVEEYSLFHAGGLKAPSRVFKLPNNSGPVSCVRAMMNGRHLVCASFDILRLYDLRFEEEVRGRKGAPMLPSLIVPGHRTGVVSALEVDGLGRYLISASGNRGWEGSSMEVVLGYEIGVPE